MKTLLNTLVAATFVAALAAPSLAFAQTPKRETSAQTSQDQALQRVYDSRDQTTSNQN